MRWLRRCALAALACPALPLAAAAGGSAAPAPPMGWNSWDAYGLTVNEEQFKANAEEIARLKAYGWRYAVIDEGWYMQATLRQLLRLEPRN